uniref:hypothetical protein n=1 Tax=Streptomyces sp. 14R-10 TaxID=1442159 RepID=UPI001E3D2BA0|nr:hypothetical protein [Streptomyces sp. 14R-10]
MFFLLEGGGTPTGTTTRNPIPEASVSKSVKKLQAQAAQDYRQHNSPETAAAYRTARGQVQSNGNAAAGTPRSSRS